MKKEKRTTITTPYIKHHNITPNHPPFT